MKFCLVWKYIIFSTTWILQPLAFFLRSFNSGFKHFAQWPALRQEWVSLQNKRRVSVPTMQLGHLHPCLEDGVEDIHLSDMDFQSNDLSHLAWGSWSWLVVAGTVWSLWFKVMVLPSLGDHFNFLDLLFKVEKYLSSRLKTCFIQNRWERFWTFALEVFIESMELRFENWCENASRIKNSVCSPFNLIFTTLWLTFHNVLLYINTFPGALFHIL